MNGHSRRYRSKLPFELAEGILAKLAISESGMPSPLRNIATSIAGRVVRGTVVFVYYVDYPIHSAINSFDWSSTRCLLPEYYHLSDSQGGSSAAQLADSAQAVAEQGKQAEEYSARIYVFEKPFPREETYAQPGVKQVPKIPKLQ